MIDYNKAKTSIFVEDQFPAFVRKEGPNFIDFIKTYYDWLEKRIVLLTLKATNEITEDQLSSGQVITSESYLIASEDDDIIVYEDAVTDAVYSDIYSLSFDGVNQYMTVANTCIAVASDWSIGVWIKLDTYPSLLLNDADIISLSNSSDFTIMKISELDNQIHSSINGADIDTGIDVRTNEWNYAIVRYNASTNMLFYDLLNMRGQYSYSTSIDLSSLTSNRLGVAYNAYSTDNFFSGSIDELSTWNSFLSDEEILSIYNEGSPIDLQTNINDYTSNSHLTNLWTFETANTTSALNTISANNNGLLIHDPRYDYNVPMNVSALITEYEATLNLLLNTISYINFGGGVEGVESNRMLLFAEHIYGKLENDLVIYSSPENKISISEFKEAKTPLNVINNLNNYQDIDYNMNYNNFISDTSFQYLMKEIMTQFPLFLHPNHDFTIKDLIGKTIKDFYQSKGTLQSIKYLFQILYGETLEIGTTLYADNNYSYVIKTRYATSPELQTIVKNLVHPIGYKVTITTP